MQKMIQLPIRVEKELVKQIDRIVKSNSLYRSRSDFIRTKLKEEVEEENKKLIDSLALEIKEELIKRGAKPGLMTKKQKKEIADEFLKKKKLI